MIHPDRHTPPQIFAPDALRLPEGECVEASHGVIIREFHGGTDELVWISFIWPGGKAEDNGRNRLSMALRLIYEGSSEMSAEEVADFFDFSGSSLSFLPNDHYSTITLTCLESQAPEALRILAGCIAEPAMPETIVDTYRRRDAQNIIIAGRKVAVEADRIASAMIMGEDNPLSRPPSAEEILALTRDELRELARHVCATSAGLTVYAAGKVTPTVIDGIDRFINIISIRESHNSPIKLQPAPFIACRPGEQRVKMTDSLQSAVVMNIPSIPRSDPDYTDLRLAVMALGGYFGSRLMTNIREDKGYTYGISAGLIGQPDGSYISIRSQQDQKYTDAVIEETVKEIYRLRDTLMDAEELARLQSHAMSDLAVVLDTPFETAFYRMMEVRTGMPHDYFERMQQSILSATPERVRDMAIKYINPEELRTAIAE